MLLLSSQGYLRCQPMVTCNHPIGTVSSAASRLCTFDEQDMLTQQLACQLARICRGNRKTSRHCSALEALSEWRPTHCWGITPISGEPHPEVGENENAGGFLRHGKFHATYA